MAKKVVELEEEIIKLNKKRFLDDQEFEYKVVN
jgi:hypothetical protein